VAAGIFTHIHNRPLGGARGVLEVTLLASGPPPPARFRLNLRPTYSSMPSLKTSSPPGRRCCGRRAISVFGSSGRLAKGPRGQVDCGLAIRLAAQLDCANLRPQTSHHGATRRQATHRESFVFLWAPPFFEFEFQMAPNSEAPGKCLFLHSPHAASESWRKLLHAIILHIVCCRSAAPTLRDRWPGRISRRGAT